eukprot:CAMPEP_0178950052 /NCGR_PEP_ID=MMETSP0789-20121207/6424_1 /TAXON_ID=3005 /ORGANISM="Rhizosolenia setigera, Strain CCMP 1694" /LENGTH=264 /DNA_ID=CAMNT_0020630707 /DNA_START=2286 /DNA_END=3080 /DNA_ORIENTATION=-
MKLFLSALFLASGVNAFVPVHNTNYATSLHSETTASETTAAETTASSNALDGLKSLSKELNPIVNYWDPLNLVDTDFYGMGQDATIGFLRHAEIKHGRVAMAAFVGYCVQSNWHWPWAMSLDGSSFPSTDLGPEAQWDAIPANAKWQILTVIGALEIWGEATGEVTDEPHYMKGGQPGKYPSFGLFSEQVHPVLNLYDPFGFNKNMSQEKKDKRLVAEINNGRLAMLGIFGFLSADKIEGSVPLLKNIAIPYDGQPMSPFEAGF